MQTLQDCLCALIVQLDPTWPTLDLRHAHFAWLGSIRVVIHRVCTPTLPVKLQPLANLAKRALIGHRRLTPALIALSVDIVQLLA